MFLQNSGFFLRCALKVENFGRGSIGTSFLNFQKLFLGAVKSCCFVFNMGNKFWLKFPVEGRRLLWLMALVFAIVFIVQYFELPYGNVFLSLSSIGKTKAANFTVGNSSSSFRIENSSERNFNFTYPSTVGDMANVSALSDGNDADGKHSDEDSDNADPEDESPSKDFIELNGNQILENVGRNDTLAPEKDRGNGFTAPTPAPAETPYVTSGNNVSLVAPTSAGNETKNSSISNPAVSAKSVDLSPPLKSPAGVDANSRTPVLVNDNTPVHKDATKTVKKREKFVFVKTDIPINYTLVKLFPKITESSLGYEGAFVPISEMNEMLLHGLASPHSVKPRWTSRADHELLNVKSLIESAPDVQDHPQLHAALFRNISMFRRSYELMEQTLKVYIYKEGERPIFHTPVLKGIYASEGWFMKLLKASKQFVTKNPKKAHLFYLPFSSRMLEETLYVPNSHNRKNLVKCLDDYLNVIKSRYQYWNRTGGSDHFLVACHDWAPSETGRIMTNCIRALCNSDIKEGFVFGKDVSLPETYVRLAQNPLRQLGGKPPSKRKILAFFAGNLHGYFRSILLKYWENKDPAMKIFGKMPNVKGQMNYIQHMQSSKYCICAKGFEVNSPRVVEAIFYECVPVIISDNFVPPFFETLNWESFAVFVVEKDILNLKNILLSIPKKKYLEMQRRVKLVQKHFLWHPKAVKYDIFHMTLHSIWFNRVFQTPAS